jgi:hypothetical protein
MKALLKARGGPQKENLDITPATEARSCSA